MTRIILWLIAVLVTGNTAGQELYPNSEPASIVPKNALGLRVMNETYQNSNGLRTWNGLMIMYGLSPKLMLNGMITGSNHHARRLPPDYSHQLLHHESKSAQKYPYLFESLSLGFRYRFINADGDHRHFRMAAFGNGVYSSRPHDEAEITLMGDNKALGGGLITTMLVKKLAISLTTGYIRPFDYQEKSGYRIRYADAYHYSLSFGYLLFPLRYKNFNQTNVNLYAEFLGKSYGNIVFLKNGEQLSSDNSAAFRAGQYIEFRPAIQFIVKSNLRIDIAAGLPLVNRSYLREYPMWQLNLQYYLFL